MEVLKTLKVKNLNGTFEQITPIGTETEYVSRKWVNPDSGNTEEITLEQSLSLIEQDIDRINGDAEIAGSIDAKINQAKEDLIGEASEVYDTFEKVQNQVEKNIKGEGLAEGDEENLYNTLYKVNNKLNQLDGSISIDGSIKQQISAAINNLKGDASTAMDTLEEIETLFNSIKSNEEEGLDSLSELASVYTQLKTLIGELPDQYKNSTVIQYIQALVNAEASRAKQQENLLSDMVQSVNNVCASEIEKIDTKVDNLHGIVVSWDGDTSELRFETDGANYWYQVSENILTHDDLLGKTVKFTYQEQIMEFIITEEYLITDVNYIEVVYNSTVLILCQNENAPHPGIYLLNDPTNAWYVQELYSKVYASAENEHNHNNKSILDNITSAHLNDINNIPIINENIGTLRTIVDEQHTPKITSLENSLESITTVVTRTTSVGNQNEVTLILIQQGNILRMNFEGTLKANWISGQNWDTIGTLSSFGIELAPSFLIRRYVIINKDRMGIISIQPTGTILLGHIFNINTSEEDTLIVGDNIRIDEVFFLDRSLQ